MATELQELIMLLLSSLITLAVPVLVVLIRTWLITRIENGRASLTAQQLFIVDMIVRTFVQAAEQSGVIGLIRDEGTAKKTWVIQQVQAELDRLGLPSVRADVIANLIEAKIIEGANQPATGPTLSFQVLDDDTP